MITYKPKFVRARRVSVFSSLARAPWEIVTRDLEEKIPRFSIERKGRAGRRPRRAAGASCSAGWRGPESLVLPYLGLRLTYYDRAVVDHPPGRPVLSAFTSAPKADNWWSSIIIQAQSSCLPGEFRTMVRAPSPPHSSSPECVRLASAGCGLWPKTEG